MSSATLLLVDDAWHAVPYVRRSSAGLSPRRPGFDSRSAHVRYVLDEVAQGQNFLQVHLIFRGPGQLSRYSDSLRAGLSGDRIPLRARIYSPVQTGPGAHPASYTMSTESFPGGVKRPGRGADHPPYLAPRLKKE